MLSPQTPFTRVACVALAASVMCVAAAGLAPRVPVARAADAGALRQRISAGQARVATLSGSVGTATSRLAQLNSSLASLQGQMTHVQTALDQKRQELLTLRAEVQAARTRLSQLEAQATHAQNVLSQQLVGSYEADRPDIVGVVLESTGFNDLLERLAFAERIGNQDARVVSQARAARSAVAAQATRLGALDARQQRLATQVLAERDALGRASAGLEQQRFTVSKARATSAAELATVRSQDAGLQAQLSKVQAAQAAPPSSPAGPSGPSGRSVGSPQTSSSGGFTFPLPKQDASPPATWTLDQGVDIAAPGGTPLLAVGSGTIVLHGIGGFGPSAPVLHLDSGPYIYYGHAGPGNWVAIGTHVSAGQVISQVGYGIVGISTGPHLEIGFADSSGSPIGSQTAPAMMSLLQASYAG